MKPRRDQGLDGRPVVVAGADSDDGAAAARALAARGAAIVLVGRDGTRLGALAAELTDAHGTPVDLFVGDPATDAESLTAMVAELRPESPEGPS